MRKILFLLFLFGSGAGNAQSTFASLHGTVRDPSGAAIPAAIIKLHGQESSTERTLTTEPDGSYNALNLEPGSFTLKVMAKGFTPTVAKDIHLNAREQLLYDVSLGISGSTTVTVNAVDAGTINTQN